MTKIVDKSSVFILRRRFNSFNAHIIHERSINCEESIDRNTKSGSKEILPFILGLVLIIFNTLCQRFPLRFVDKKKDFFDFAFCSKRLETEENGTHRDRPGSE